MPTLALMRGAPEEEACALGEWPDKVDTAMPVRYAEGMERQAVTAIVKLLQTGIIAQAAEANSSLSWGAMRLELGRIDIEERKERVTGLFCKDDVQQETQQSWLKPVA